MPSRLTDQAYHVQFSHLWNGIATRHSDTVDTKFFVDGRGVIVGLAHKGFVAFRERAGRDLTDREGALHRRRVICASAWNRKTSARSMMSLKPTSSASSKRPESASLLPTLLRLGAQEKQLSS